MANIVVDWRGVGLSVTVGKKKNAFEKKILTDVNGGACPGELLAIMGPSGAGKTSLLNCLADRTKPTSGNVLFNGKAMRPSYRRRIAFVHQQEMLLASLSPQEHLEFQSKLRLPSQVTAREREDRIEKCLNLFGLEKNRHSLIGDAYGGISKNERRRLAFAAEVLSEPAVLFADEPTTGLDSAFAEAVVKYMRALAAHGEKVTILATIHQPSSEVFRMFDKVCFMVDGKVGYFGPTSQVARHFASVGFPIPLHTPPAEFIMQVCIDPKDPQGAAEKREKICNAWATTAHASAKDLEGGSAVHSASPQHAEEEKAEEEKESGMGIYNASPLQQFLSLARRDMLMKLRAKTDLRSTIVRCLLFAVLFGLVYFQAEITYGTVFSITGALFFAQMMGVMNQAIGASMSLPERMPTLLREHKNGAYSVLSIYISKTISDLPFDGLITVIWSTLLFWMIGFRDSFTHFLQFLLTMWVLTLTATGIGYLGGFTMPTGSLAMLVNLVNIMPQMLFGGLFINLNSVPSFFIWLREISVFKHGYDAFMLIIFQDIGEIPCEDDPVERDPITGECRLRDGLAVLEFYGVNPSGNYLHSVGYIAIILAFYRILALLCLLWRARPRQFEGAAPEDDTKGELGVVPTSAVSRQEVERPALSLQWRGLSVAVQKQDTKASKRLQVLSGCNGDLQPGELMAVMGPSGSGKSVLLKALANVGELPIEDGQILVNNAPWSEKWRRQTGFMYQEELLFSGLTVREHLIYQSKLRGSGVGLAQTDRIDQLINELGLYKVRSTLIGEIGAGISGGERKRLAFATELLNDPSLLFADEPTSGLDSSMARNVTSLLRDCAHGRTSGEGITKPRTILCTIHQPSGDVFNLFDKLLILVNGQTAYCGSISAALDHFASLGLVCPSDVSPPDFYMRVVAIDVGEEGEREQAQTNLKMLVSNVAAPSPLAATARAEESPVTSAGGFRPSLAIQVLTLVRREALMRRRSKVLFKAVIARTMLMSIMLGLLYFDIDHDQAGAQSIMGAITVLMLNTFMTGGVGLTHELPHALRPAFRESKVGMYSLTAWFWAKTIGDFFIDTIIPFLGVTVFFWMARFREEPSIWLAFSAITVVVSLMGQTWGYFCSMVSGSPESAFTTFMLTVVPALAFAGFVIPTEEVPSYFRWVEVIGPFKYLFGLYTTLIWDTHGELKGCENQNCPFPDGDAVLAFFGIDPRDFYLNVAVCCIYLVVGRALAWLFLILRGPNSPFTLTWRRVRTEGACASCRKTTS